MQPKLEPMVLTHFVTHVNMGDQLGPFHPRSKLGVANGPCPGLRNSKFSVSPSHGQITVLLNN